MAESAVRRSKRIALRASSAGVDDPNWRDWAGLPALVVDKIAGRVLDGDVADLVRFRAACKPWTEGTTDPRALGAGVIDHRFHPRRWIPLTEPAGATRRRLLNVTTRKVLQVDLPELAGHSVVAGPAGAPEGVLVLRDEATLVVRLLNPLTRHAVDLPTLRTLQRGRRRGPISREFREDHEVTAAGFADESTVVLHFGHIREMAVAKPGDTRWTLVGGVTQDVPLKATATFHGRFYCVDREELMVVSLEQPAGPQLVVAVDMGRLFRTVSLVDDGGSLMAVCSREHPVRLLNANGSILETAIELFHVDLEEDMLMPIHDLGKRTVFTGPLGAVLLPSTQHYPSIKPGRVYFRFRTTQRHFRAFEVRRRHTTYIASVWGRLANHIASYVTHSNIE